MLGDVSGVRNIYIVTGHTDMRKSIDGLVAIIRDVFMQDPFSNSLFLFCGCRCDRIKAIHYEKLSADFCYPHIFSFLLKMMGIQ